MHYLARLIGLTGFLLFACNSAGGQNLQGLEAEEYQDNKIIKRSSTFIPEWKQWLFIEETGIRNSGVFWYQLSLLGEEGDKTADFPRLLGFSFLVSPNNKQIFACEDNPDGNGEALLFNTKGEIVARIDHAGFPRECGLTDDKLLYWYMFSNSVNMKPFTEVIVINDSGKIVNGQKFNKSGIYKFEYNGEQYQISLPEPELPG